MSSRDNITLGLRLVVPSLALGLTLATLSAQPEGPDAHTTAALTAQAGLAAVLYPRPIAAITGVIGLTLVGAALAGAPPRLGFVAAVAAFELGRRCGPVVSVPTCLAALLAVVGWTVVPWSAASAAEVARVATDGLVLLAGASIAGLVARGADEHSRHAHDIASARRRTEAVRRENQLLVERARVAAALNDVATHHIVAALVGVRAMGVAGAAADTDDTTLEMARALATARHTASALDDGVGHRAPQPSLRRLCNPAAVRAAFGPWVRVSVPAEFPPGEALGHLAYRLVAVAVANAAVHAPGVVVRVDIEVADTILLVRVTNELRGDVTARRAFGEGVLTMHRLVNALGGLLRVGPDGSTWRVEAQIPCAARIGVS